MTEMAHTYAQAIAKEGKSSIKHWLWIQCLQIVAGLFVGFVGIDRLANSYEPFTIKLLLWSMVGLYFIQTWWFAMRGRRERMSQNDQVTPMLANQLLHSYMQATWLFLGYCAVELMVFGSLAHSR
jgi:hypothetical protein